MFEIDKENFGAFVAQLRREKGLTQKELAARLYVSDKTVSKWEVGGSIPDVGVLVPLARELGVSVSELLECRRIPDSAPMEPERVEELVRTALCYQEEPVRRGAGKKLPFFAALILGVLLTVGLYLGGFGGEALYVMTLLGGIFGWYFWCFAPERLPRYYDENKVYYYGDGFFRMNMVGVAFNNRNWPHILRAARLWCVFVLAFYPLLQLVMMLFSPAFWNGYGMYVTLVVVLGGLFLPIIYVGRKYE